MSCFAGCWWAQAQLRLQLVVNKELGVWGVGKGKTSPADFQGCSSTPEHPGHEGSCLTLTPESPLQGAQELQQKNALNSALPSWWSGSGTKENEATAPPDTAAPRQGKLQGKSSLKPLPIPF